MVSSFLGVLQPLKKNENETMLEAELLGRNATRSDSLLVQLTSWSEVWRMEWAF